MKCQAMRIGAVGLLAFCVWWSEQVRTGAGPLLLLSPAPLISMTNRPVQIQTAVIRLIRKEKIDLERIEGAIKNKRIEQAVERLQAKDMGIADLMYVADRELADIKNATAEFSAIEHRPPFIIPGMDKPAQPPVFKTFGLNLKIGALPSVNAGETMLMWEGNYSWSTNFVGMKWWQMIASGVLTAGSIFGAGFEEGGWDREGVDVGNVGINPFKFIRKAKAKAPEPPTVEQIPHYLDAPRLEVGIKGAKSVPEEEWIVSLLIPPDGSPETFVLLMKFTPVR